MSTAKEVVQSLLEDLPSDATYADIQYTIYVREKVERARQAIRAGEIASDAEVEATFARWLTPR